MMNIFEYAMQMEKDGENYYRQLALQTANKGLKTILTMLADEEVKHYNAVERMKTEEPQMADTTILTDAKNVFVKIKESNENFTFDIKQTELYNWEKLASSKKNIRKNLSCDWLRKKSNIIFYWRI